uniref:Ectonucleoside triphosphate diphosphohydrolase 8 n=1 Tax=Denticeps clupeoides TaxID=299321 RepID=A0AAY4ACP5_9TELE
HFKVFVHISSIYGMVFDAGSSHTALFIYKWPGNKENNTAIVSQALLCDVEGGGISSYKQNPLAAGQSLRKCLDVAKATIPAKQHGTSPVYLGATAGMRLLKLQDQAASDQILEEVRKAIQAYPFNFQGARILSGKEEGAYGWITINYLMETLIKHSFEGRWVLPKDSRVIGSMDLGGASTQISFTPSGPIRDPGTAEILQLYGKKYDLYSHSYLCYGKDQALKIAQAYLVQAGRPGTINHPCYHLGYNQTLTMGDLYNSPCVNKPTGFDPSTNLTFVGTGEPNQCSNLMLNIINVSTCSLSPDCGFNGVYQPPVNGIFFAFSAYFYTFDFLGLAPQAPLPKVTLSIESFCNKTWKTLLTEYPKTPEKYLREYCASAQYIMNVLLQGYKFNQSWDKIFFQKQVADTDIGWTLGYMLNLTNLIPSESPITVTGLQRGQWVAEVFFIAFVLFLTIVLLSVVLTLDLS